MNEHQMTTKDKILKLLPLSGKSLKELPFQVGDMGDFLYHEGPLLSHFSNEKQENFLMKWCDKDIEYHRWLIFKTTTALLFDYFQEKYSLLDLIHKCPDNFVYFVDIAAGAVWKNFFQVDSKAFPSDYLPFPNSFFGDTYFEEYAHELKARLEYRFSCLEKRYEPTEEHAPLVAMEPPAAPYQAKNKTP